MRPREVLAKCPELLKCLKTIGEGEKIEFRVIVDDLMTNRFDADTGRKIPRIPVFAASATCQVRDPKTNQPYTIGNIIGSQPREIVRDGQRTTIIESITEQPDFGTSGVIICDSSKQDLADFLMLYPTNRSFIYRNKNKKPKFFVMDSVEELNLQIRDQNLEDDAILMLKDCGEKEMRGIIEGLPGDMKNKFNLKGDSKAWRAQLRSFIRAGKYEVILQAADNPDYHRKVQIAEAEQNGIIVLVSAENVWKNRDGEVILSVDPGKDMRSELNRYLKSTKGHELYKTILEELDDLEE